MNLPLLAAFVSPGLFYVGLAGVAGPILIHLFARRRFKRIRWAAMEFLIDAERRNRRRVRIEELILLALRCAAMALIGVLVARPFVAPGGATAWAGRARIERVFLLDDSLSMSYASADGTAFDRAKRAVRRLVETFRRESPDDTVTVVRLTAPQTPLESGVFLDETQTEALLSRVEALAVTQQAGDPADAVHALADLLSRSESVLNAAVYIISDFQRRDWVQREAGVAAGATPSAALLEPLSNWAGKDRGLRTVLVNVGDPEAANRAVTELTSTGGPAVAGATANLRATLANYGPAGADNLEVRVSAGGLMQPSKTVPTLATGQTATIDVNAEFLRSGFDSAQVELPPDALAADDARYLALEVSTAIRVLIVNGEPSVDEFDDEAALLRTALRPEGDVFSGNEVVVVDEPELEETNLSGFHVVVLANVYRVSDPAAEMLERFVRGGGGVAVFLGDQVDAGLYNSALFRDGAGLLPAALGDRVRAAPEVHLRVVDRLHPVMRGLSAEGDPLGLGAVSFFEYFTCVPAAGEPGAGEPASGDAAAAGASGERGTARAAQVVAAFDDAEQHPAIVERALGPGKVILITTSADKEWHRWPEHPTFLPVMMELMRHVARHGDALQEQWVGAPITMPVDASAFAPDVRVRTPAYPEERELSVTALSGEDGRGLVLTWEHTRSSGIYQFALQRRDGGEVVRLVAVNVDPRESALATSDEAELRRALGGVPFEYVQGIDRLAGESGEGRVELWRAALLAAAIVLITEHTLAWGWGRRR
ncbi:MAG: BatA domain-containing protein [Planctomycetes bacterium]|nr:BatA domain-containing protein [Planctomycetota bacterium]